jgi:hypothetical protein
MHKLLGAAAFLALLTGCEYPNLGPPKISCLTDVQKGTYAWLTQEQCEAAWHADPARQATFQARQSELDALERQRVAQLNLDEHGIRKDFVLTSDCTYGPDGLQTMAEVGLYQRCKEQRANDWAGFVNTPQARALYERCMQRNAGLITEADQRLWLSMSCLNQVQAQHDLDLQEEADQARRSVQGDDSR